MSDAASYPPSGIPIDNFSTLAGKLQETAEALRVFCRSLSAGEGSSKAEAGTESREQALEPGEYRQYHLPPHTLREENEFLEHYGARNVADALDAIHNDLFITVFLMKGYATDDEVDSFNLCLIGEQLSRSLDMLSKAGSVLTDFELVRVTKIPE